MTEPTISCGIHGLKTEGMLSRRRLNILFCYGFIGYMLGEERPVSIAETQTEMLGRVEK